MILNIKTDNIEFDDLIELFYRYGGLMDAKSLTAIQKELEVSIIKYIKSKKLGSAHVIGRYYTSYITKADGNDAIIRKIKNEIIATKSIRVINAYSTIVGKDYKKHLQKLVEIPKSLNNEDLKLLSSVFNDVVYNPTEAKKRDKVRDFYELFVLRDYKKDGISDEFAEFMIQVLFKGSRWMLYLIRGGLYAKSRNNHYDENEEVLNKIKEFVLAQNNTNLKNIIKLMNGNDVRGLSGMYGEDVVMFERLNEYIFNDDFYNEIKKNRELKKFLMEIKLGNREE